MAGGIWNCEIIHSFCVISYPPSWKLISCQHFLWMAVSTTLISVNDWIKIWEAAWHRGEGLWLYCKVSGSISGRAQNLVSITAHSIIAPDLWVGQVESMTKSAQSVLIRVMPHCSYTQPFSLPSSLPSLFVLCDGFVNINVFMG